MSKLVSSLPCSHARQLAGSFFGKCPSPIIDFILLSSIQSASGSDTNRVLVGDSKTKTRLSRGKILSRFQRFSGDTFLPFAGSLLQSLARLFGCSFTSPDGDESTWDGMVGVAVNPRRPFRALPWL